jgi:hypothetical protein
VTGKDGPSIPAMGIGGPRCLPQNITGAREADVRQKCERRLVCMQYADSRPAEGNAGEQFPDDNGWPPAPRHRQQRTGQARH